jgi:hypothetical protein
MGAFSGIYAGFAYIGSSWSVPYFVALANAGLFQPMVAPIYMEHMLEDIYIKQYQKIHGNTTPMPEGEYMQLRARIKRHYMAMISMGSAGILSGVFFQPGLMHNAIYTAGLKEMVGKTAGVMIGGVPLEFHIAMILIGGICTGIILAAGYMINQRKNTGENGLDRRAAALFCLGLFTGALMYFATMIPGLDKAFTPYTIDQGLGQSFMTTLIASTMMFVGVTKAHAHIVTAPLRLSQSKVVQNADNELSIVQSAAKKNTQIVAATM